MANPDSVSPTPATNPTTVEPPAPKPAAKPAAAPPPAARPAPPAGAAAKARPPAGKEKQAEPNRLRRRVIWTAFWGYIAANFFMFLRFFFPRALFEPSTVHTIGYPSDYS